MRGLYTTVDAETKKSLTYEKSIGEMKSQVKDLEAQLKMKKEELEAYKEREKCSQIDELQKFIDSKNEEIMKYPSDIMSLEVVDY